MGDFLYLKTHWPEPGILSPKPVVLVLGLGVVEQTVTWGLSSAGRKRLKDEGDSRGDP